MELLKSVLDAALTFPTVIFTVLLALVVLYWLVATIGGLGDSVGGAAEGLLEGVTEGAVEGLAEGVFEGAADGLAEGALEGVADGAAEGLGDAGVHFSGSLAKAIGCLGITAVPVTLFLSILILFSWGLSIGLSKLVGRHIGVGSVSLVVGGGIAITALVFAVILTSWAVRPLKPLFRSDQTIRRGQFVGQLCTVTTLRVDDDFGMAEYDDGQAGLLLQVRCDQPNSLTRGDRARVARYDRAGDLLYLAPVRAEKQTASTNPSNDARKPHDNPDTEGS